MRTHRRVSRLWLVTVVLGAAALIPSQALASQVSCGDTISKDTKLHRDLTNCPGDGVVIGADNITLDLNGHKIDGDGAPGGDDPDTGIENDGNQGVTIQKGTVQEFDAGVVLVGAGDNHLRHLSSSENLDFGLILDNVTDGRIERGSFSGNGFSGVVLIDSDGNRFERNTARGTLHASVFLFGSDDNRIEKNVLTDNGDGIEVHESDRNDFRKNTISRSTGPAIDLSDGSAHNVVEKNRMSNNGDGLTSFEGQDNLISRNTITGTGQLPDQSESGGFGIILDGVDDNSVERNLVVGGRGQAIFIASLDSANSSDRNVVSRNVVNSELSDGILVDGTATATLLERNTANRSGDDGIDADSPAATLTRNTANRNHDLGIEAVPGVTDGGGNRARGNGNPLQCTTIDCR